MSGIVTASGRVVGERTLIFLVGAVQFVNILDFMMVAPLGPRLAVAVGMPESHVSDIVAAYTLAAGVAGVAGSFFLDRFDRRPALAICLAGLAIGTALGGLATDLPSLLAARMVAGMFGGPASSIAIAIVSDVVPIERRGRAMGAVMGAFAAASVLGIPMGIVLAEIGSWRTPFFAVAALGALAVLGTLVFLPSLRVHLQAAAPKAPSSLRSLLSRPAVLASYAMTLTASAGVFTLVPNIATFVQNNLGLPEEQLKWMYLAGGIVSFVTTRVTGVFVDRLGAVRVAIAGSILQVAVIYVAFARTDLLPYEQYLLPCMFGMFTSFMLASGVRNVAYQAQTTRVPRPAERARFTSLQSSVSHVSAALGAALAGRILGVDGARRLTGMPAVALVSIGFALVLPALVVLVERRLRIEGDA